MLDLFSTVFLQSLDLKIIAKKIKNKNKKAHKVFFRFNCYPFDELNMNVEGIDRWPSGRIEGCFGFISFFLVSISFQLLIFFTVFKCSNKLCWLVTFDCIRLFWGWLWRQEQSRGHFGGYYEIFGEEFQTCRDVELKVKLEVFYFFFFKHLVSIIF